jgi:hypothetical protein
MEQKLIPFNLDRALAGDTVITKDRRIVINFAYLSDAIPGSRIICVIPPNIESQDKSNILITLFENGKMFEYSDSGFDLFMLQVEKEYYMLTAVEIKTGNVINSVLYTPDEEGTKGYIAAFTLWSKEDLYRDVQEHKITRVHP